MSDRRRFFYAIRNKQTGYYLPGYGSRKGHGGFTSDKPEREYPPRLFWRLQDAKLALWHWLKGRVQVWYDHEGEENWTHTCKHDRKAYEMEIVEIRISTSKVVEHVHRL